MQLYGKSASSASHVNQDSGRVNSGVPELLAVQRLDSLGLSTSLTPRQQPEDNNNQGNDRMVDGFESSVKVINATNVDVMLPILQPVLIVDCNGRSNIPSALLSSSERHKSIEETLAILNNDEIICRICHCGDGDTLSLDERTSVSSWTQPDSTNVQPVQPIVEMNLITPCFCSGSLRYVHHYCLQQWIRSSNHKHCELCKFHFKMSVKYKPFLQWERLEMSVGERKKLLCNLLFNLISMFCVFWSIYVLIERATLEAKYGLLEWPFWIKMLVVSIGFLGGIVFLFVQLRLYFTIFLRWRQFNRTIVIHDLNDSSKESSPQRSCNVQVDSVELVK